MTWLKATLSRITARNASTRANGANIEKKEKLQSRGWELHSQRKLFIAHKYIEPNNMGGDNQSTAFRQDLTVLRSARGPSLTWVI